MNTQPSPVDGSFFRRSDSWVRLAAVLFFLCAAYYFLRYPFGTVDSDTWYHLAGGRRLFQNKAIPSDAFFSFITPEKHWENYYWLFQAVLYGFYSVFGLLGPVVLRTLAYLAALCFIFLFLRPEKTDSSRYPLFFLALFTAYGLALIPREIMTRPHTISYLFIAVFLYILERKPGKAWLLPLLSILWVNFHGIEYPVLALIIGAYLLDIFLDGFRKEKRYAAYTKPRRWSLILSLPCICATPYGANILLAPFLTSPMQEAFVMEMLPLSLKQVLTFALYPPALLLVAGASLIFLTAPMSLIALSVARRIRISHVLLFAGAAVLLTIYNRFLYEYILLSLPLVRQGGRLVFFRPGTKPTIRSTVLVSVLILALGITGLAGKLSNRPGYPYSPKTLPQGCTAFLNSLDAGGTVLNHPNVGGYLEWELKPSYSIFTDMQLSIFTPEDIFFSSIVFNDPAILAKFIATYDPAFILAPRATLPFGENIQAHPEYAPVFMDDVAVLYADAARNPGLVEQYTLKALDPFAISKLDSLKPETESFDLVFEEVRRMHGFAANDTMLNYLLSNLYFQLGRMEDSLGHARAIVRFAPDNPHGYLLSAKVYYKQEDYQTCISQCTRAAALADDANAESAYRLMSMAQTQLGQYRAAFDSLGKAVNPFTNPEYRDIIKLAVAACAAEKYREAALLLRMAEAATPSTDAESLRKIEETRELFQLNPSDKAAH